MSNTAGLQVRFSLEPRKVNGEWMDIPYIRIISMTDKYNAPHRPLTEKDKERFSKQYEAWVRGQTERPAGQPLKTWPGITPAEVNVLAQADIHTVEALAAAPARVVGEAGPYQALQEAAQRYLAMAKSAAPMEALQAKANAYEAEIRTLRERVGMLEASQDEDGAEAPKRRGPGRPPKPRPEVSEEA